MAGLPATSACGEKKHMPDPQASLSCYQRLLHVVRDGNREGMPDPGSNNARTSFEPRHGETRQADTSLISQTQTARRRIGSQAIGPLNATTKPQRPHGFFNLTARTASPPAFTVTLRENGRRPPASGL